jgi:CrcB protein
VDALTLTMVTLGMSLGALTLGFEFAPLLRARIPRHPFKLAASPTANGLTILVGLAFWAGAAILCGLYAPWRQSVTFALVLGPAGALLRYLLSRLLNPQHPWFPIGTFTANVLATAIVAIAFLIERISPARRTAPACATLHGVTDGFCGALSTISTFVVEIRSLDRKNAWIYLVASWVTGIVLVILLFGLYKWTRGLSPYQQSCSAFVH